MNARRKQAVMASSLSASSASSVRMPTIANGPDNEYLYIFSNSSICSSGIFFLIFGSFR
jgi:hypothetical protein